MLPPETTATTFLWPRAAIAGDTAAATAQAAAPSAITWTRSATSAHRRGGVVEGDDERFGTHVRSSGHIVSSTERPPAPSTNDGASASNWLARPAANDAASGAAVSGSAA